MIWVDMRGRRQAFCWKGGKRRDFGDHSRDVTFLTVKSSRNARIVYENFSSSMDTEKGMEALQ